MEFVVGLNLPGTQAPAHGLYQAGLYEVAASRCQESQAGDVGDQARGEQEQASRQNEDAAENLVARKGTRGKGLLQAAECLKALAAGKRGAGGPGGGDQDNGWKNPDVLPHLDEDGQLDKGHESE